MDFSRGRSGYEYTTRSGVTTSMKRKKGKKKKKKNNDKMDSDMAGDAVGFISRQDKIVERRHRFQSHSQSHSHRHPSNEMYSSDLTSSSLMSGIMDRSFSIDDGSRRDWMKKPIIGKFTGLEKGYLRLTSAPDPGQVRSPDTCVRTFDMLRRVWSSGERGYLFVGEQLKSLRQDLRVQHIRDELTIEVYEFNSRVCLQVRDMSEFNQCLSQLWGLYTPSMFADAAIVSEGKVVSDSSLSSNVLEFVCLRLLYCAVTKSTEAFYECVKKIRSYMKKGGFLKNDVQRAMDVFKCVNCNQFETFFEHYNWYIRMNNEHREQCKWDTSIRSASESQRYEYLVLDQIVWRLRFEALKSAIVSVSSIHKVSVNWFAFRLGFLNRRLMKKSDDKDDVEMMDDSHLIMMRKEEMDETQDEEMALIECLDYLQRCNVCLDAMSENVLCKDSYKNMSSLVMFVPKSKDEEMGVTHGSMFSDAAADKDMTAGFTKFLRKS